MMSKYKYETCLTCKTPFAMSREIYRMAQDRRENFQFYCPNGHPQHYVTGESEVDKMRRELNRAKQNAAYKDDALREARGERDAALNSARAYKGVATKMKKRANAGVCPCCNRTFENLARHMKTKHPNSDNIVEFGQAAEQGMKR